MLLVVRALTAFVAVQHLGFFWLESFAWRTRAGKIFGMPPEHVEITASMASNQGLYNALLAGGLIVGAAYGDTPVGNSFRLYFLAAVVIAGLWGGATVSGRILVIQAAPAAVALALAIATLS